MDKKLLRSVREYKKQSFLTPVLVAAEVFVEVLIPLLMAKIIDVGIMNGDMAYIIKLGALLVLLAVVALFFGAKAGQLAAGLAGGSSNAAAVLFGMNRLFRLGLSKEELMERGVKLGADVPYCIMRGTVLAEGIGEELKELPPMPKCTVLIAKPPISVSTKVVYEALDAKEISEHPDIDGVIEGLEEGSLKKVASAMGNVLEDVTIPMHPVIEEIKQEMKECGALNAMMSGSGPTVFGLFENRTAAREAQRRIREKSLAGQVYVTSIHGVRRN